MSPNAQDELHRAYIPLLEALFPDYRVGGFSPGFLMLPRDNYNGHGSFNLPLDAARNLRYTSSLDKLPPNEV